jgi:hypothetical protein
MPSVDPAADPPPARGGAYDYDGVVLWEYSPELDHDPDPGEVVWTWVAFEDDPSIGKDRPVAVIGAPSAPRPPSTAPARATSPGFFGKIAGLFRRKT